MRLFKRSVAVMPGNPSAKKCRLSASQPQRCRRQDRCGLRRHRPPRLPPATTEIRMTTVGEALVQLLKSYDVDTVFGIPGVHSDRTLSGPRRIRRFATSRRATNRGRVSWPMAMHGQPASPASPSSSPVPALPTRSPRESNHLPIPFMLVISGVNQRENLTAREWASCMNCPISAPCCKQSPCSRTAWNGPTELPIVLARALAVSLPASRPCSYRDTARYHGAGAGQCRTPCFRCPHTPRLCRDHGGTLCVCVWAPNARQSS